MGKIRGYPFSGIIPSIAGNIMLAAGIVITFEHLVDCLEIIKNAS